MRRGSNSPPYHKRRSPLRRDRRDVPSRRRRSFSRDRQDGNKLRRFSPSFKRSRREDDHYDRHDRLSPSRRGYDRDRERGRDGHDRRDVPDSYREFILHLPNDIKPEEAHRRYQQYLTDWHGSLAKSEFEQYKHEDWMKAKNDPRTIIQIIEEHKQRGQEAAKKFAEDLEASKELDIQSEDFNQGEVRNEEQTEEVEGEKSAPENEFVAPQVCWSVDRVKVDLDLSAELIRKLDAEKEITCNPLLDSSSSSQQDKPEAEYKEDKGEEKNEEGAVVEDDGDLLTKKLDLQLTYLWRVHMVDYYSGHELSDKEYESTKCRMIRPSKAQEKDDETDKKMLEELSIRVNAFWTDRMNAGDPLELKAQRTRIEKSIEDFVESQVVPIDDKRWGNKLSSKMFVGKEFVLKHIRLKHTSVVDAEREKIMEEIYYENFRKQKAEDERKLAEHKRTAPFDPQSMDVSFDGYGGEGFGPGNPGVMGAPMVPAPMMGAPMRQVLMPAPGAGPLGPFVLQSVPAASGMPPMDMGPMSGASRGFDSASGRPPRSMSGTGEGSGGGGGTRPPWDGQKEYYDLDAPQNNRAVLDYGDL